MLMSQQRDKGEMLMSQQRDKGEIIDYQSNRHWKDFVTSLQDKGYFQVN